MYRVINMFSFAAGAVGFSGVVGFQFMALLRP